MAKDGKSKTPPERPGARERIAAACRQVVAGKLAARDLAQWVAGCDLSEVEFRLLWMLFDATVGDKHAELEQGALVVLLAASPALVSGAVERLRLLGYLDSRANAADRRRQLWRLTPAGDAQVRSIVSAVEALAAPAIAASPSSRRDAA
jgi:DNA-binding MarR family transcriptional regulator